MKGRIIASLAFVGGGVVTWFVLRMLYAFAFAIGGMSSGPGTAPPGVDAAIPWLFCCYFVVSAIGIAVFQKPKGMRVAALVAHLFVLAGFIAICYEGIREDTGKFLMGIVELGLIVFFYFLPWLIIWSVFLFKRDSAA